MVFRCTLPRHQDLVMHWRQNVKEGGDKDGSKPLACQSLRLLACSLLLLLNLPTRPFLSSWHFLQTTLLIPLLFLRPALPLSGGLSKPSISSPTACLQASFLFLSV